MTLEEASQELARSCHRAGKAVQKHQRAELTALQQHGAGRSDEVLSMKLGVRAGMAGALVC